MQPWHVPTKQPTQKLTLKLNLNTQTPSETRITASTPASGALTSTCRDRNIRHPQPHCPASLHHALSACCESQATSEAGPRAQAASVYGKLSEPVVWRRHQRSCKGRGEKSASCRAPAVPAFRYTHTSIYSVSVPAAYSLSVSWFSYAFGSLSTRKWKKAPERLYLRHADAPTPCAQGRLAEHARPTGCARSAGEQRQHPILGARGQARLRAGAQGRPRGPGACNLCWRLLLGLGARIPGKLPCM